MVPDPQVQTLLGHARHLGNAVKKLLATRCGSSHLNAFVAADARGVDQQQKSVIVHLLRKEEIETKKQKVIV